MGRQTSFRTLIPKRKLDELRRVSKFEGYRREPGTIPERDAPKPREEVPEKQHLPFLSISVSPVMTPIGDEAYAVTVIVENNGNTTAFYPMVELISGEPGPVLSSGNRGPAIFRRRGQASVGPLWSHEQRQLSVSWDRMLDAPVLINHVASARRRIAGLVGMRFIALCYDPILDPKPSPPYHPAGQPAHHQKIYNVPLGQMQVEYQPTTQILGPHDAGSR